MRTKYGEPKDISTPTTLYTKCDFFYVCEHRKEQDEHICYHETDQCSFKRNPTIRGKLERKLRIRILEF